MDIAYIRNIQKMLICVKLYTYEQIMYIAYIKNVQKMLIFYLKSKVKAEMLAFRRFKDKCCRFCVKLYTYEQFLKKAYYKDLQKMLILLKQIF